MNKIGLVMEGGAMRGLFSAGVIDVLMENGIRFDGMIGVSAGAAFGCNYKSNQPGRVIRYNLRYCRDPRYCSIRSLFKTGDLFGADFCYHELPDRLDIFDADTFEKSPMEFYVVCTDVQTGKPVYRKCDTASYNDLEWMRASASMPLASKAVEVDGYKLLDGGIADSIPLRYFETIGYVNNVVILTQPRDYFKTKNKLMPVMKIALKKYPAVIKSAAERHKAYNSTKKYIFDAEKQGRAFIMCPDAKLPIGRIEHNPEKLRNVYNLGRRCAERKLESLKRFLEDKRSVKI